MEIQDIASTKPTEYAILHVAKKDSYKQLTTATKQKQKNQKKRLQEHQEAQRKELAHINKVEVARQTAYNSIVPYKLNEKLQNEKFKYTHIVKMVNKVEQIKLSRMFNFGNHYKKYLTKFKPIKINFSKFENKR